MFKKIIFLLAFLFIFIPDCYAKKMTPSEMTSVSLQELEFMALSAKDELWQQAKKNQQPVKLYLHWSAGHYGELYDSYHINIDADGKIYTSTRDLSQLKYHTYMRNSGSIGISVSSCFNGTPKNLGNEPPTELQLETMAQVIATLSLALNIPIDRNHIMTHGEAADNVDKYFPPYENNGRPYGMYGPMHNSERWDLAILKNGDQWQSGGNTLRLKSILALFHLRKERNIGTITQN